MSKQKIAVRYQSQGGNTKAVAEVIAKVAGVKAESIDVPIKQPVDILFVGGGVYKWGLDAALKSFLENLNPDIVKSIAAFTTAGWMNKTKDIIEIAKAKGIPVCDETLPFKALFRNHAALGGKGQINLSENEVNNIEAFTKKVIGG